MKTKHIILAAVAALGLVASLFAAEEQANNATSQVIKLKSHGETVAELRLVKKTTPEIKGGGILVGKTGNVDFKGGITIILRNDGGSPITIKADEVEVVPTVK